MALLKRSQATITLPLLAVLAGACERQVQIGLAFPTSNSTQLKPTETPTTEPAASSGNQDAPATAQTSDPAAAAAKPDESSTLAPAPVSVVPVSKTDVFSVKANKKIDILMVIDNSGSMGDKQQVLKDSFAAFISDFITKGLDFHIGIISTDVDTPTKTNQWSPTAVDSKGASLYAYTGYLNPIPGGLLSKTSDKFLTSSTANLSDAFKTNASVGLKGSGSERGLASTTLSLSDSLRNGYNSGFIRDDAYLSVVIFSDENELVDKSTVSGGINNDCGIRDATHDSTRLSSFVSALKNAKKGSLERVRVDAFVGTTLAAGDARPANSACNPINRDPLMNYSMYKSAVDTVQNGGEVHNILTDFSVPLANVGSRIATQAERTYTLAKVPVSNDSINVRINGVKLNADANNGWSYDASSHQIKLNGTALPDGDFSLEVEYQTLP